MDAAAQQALSGAEIRSLIQGKTYRWEAPNGMGGTISVFADGAQQMTTNIPDVPTDTGSWRISGNELCSTWQRIRNGAESCQTLTRTGERTYVSSTGVRLIFD